MSTFVQDLRFGLRLLWKDRSFTVTALLTLAICIGANAAMFAIVRSVILKPLPFPGADRIVYLYNSYPNAGVPRIGAAIPDYFDRQAAVKALDESALFRRDSFTYGDENGAQRVIALRATPSFMHLVGVQPTHGRLFTEGEGEVGQNNKVLLTDGFWKRVLGGNPSIVGQTIRLNGVPTDVVGILPRDFTFLQNDVDLYLPAAFRPQDKADDQRHSNSWQMVGRLAPGATIGQVQQQVDALNAQNEIRYPQYRELMRNAHFHTVAVRLQDDVVRDVKRVLYLLWAAVVFVLVIGAVNIANLVMVRNSARTREMATRHALGGDLGRLARQLMTETTLLSIAGGVLGLLLAWWATRSLSALNLDQLPRGYEISLDVVSILVILALTTIVGLLLGIAPVIRLWRINLNVELREESRGGTSGRRAIFVRRALATAQVAIALVLLVGAGLLLASFRQVMQVDYGFQPDHVVTGSVNLPQTTYKDTPAIGAFVQRAVDGLRQIPGVETAGGVIGLPFSGQVNAGLILAEGYVMKPGESVLAPTSIIATDGYFEAMHVRLLSGRFFDARDTFTSPKVALIDDRLAKKFWPGQDAVGRRLYSPSDSNDLTKITPQTDFFNVIGVIREVQMLDPRADVTPVGAYYFPFSQFPRRGLTFTVKTRGDSATIQNDMRRTLAALDSQLPLFRVQPMQAWIDTALSGRRIPMLIAAAFGVVALLLSGVGIYGVLAYGVAERRRELGVRMALGGSTMSVFRLVLGDGLRIVGIGLAIGLASSLAVSQVLKSQLFNVAPINPLVLGSVTIILSGVAIVATAIPALRASRINPNVVLSK
jgi:predicted permease